MNDIIKAVADTPVPTILVVAGIFFLLMSVASKVSAHLSIPENRKKQSLLLGVGLLLGGVVLSFVPALEQSDAATAEAAAAVKQTPANWDVAWGEMDEEDRVLWSKLGWTEEDWNNDARPVSYEKAFGALTPAQQDAVMKLGFTPAQWDASD